jgi:hypothetical protein
MSEKGAEIAPWWLRIAFLKCAKFSKIFNERIHRRKGRMIDVGVY